jgi:hypothetical protein
MNRSPQPKMLGPTLAATKPHSEATIIQTADKMSLKLLSRGDSTVFTVEPQQG